MATAEQLPPLPRVLLERVLDPEVQGELRAEYDRFVESLRGERPASGSDRELDALVAFIELGIELIRHLEVDALALLRSDIQGQLDALIREELEATETLRKLALRHLQSCVETVGKIVEAMGLAHLEIPREALIEGLDDSVDSIVASFENDPDLRSLLGWWLSLTVALESIHGVLDDFTYWSRRAIEEARGVEVLLPRISEQSGASRGRLRARWSWNDWDDQDVEDELQAWEELTKSP